MRAAWKAWKASHRLRMLDQSDGSVSTVHRGWQQRKQIDAYRVAWKDGEQKRTGLPRRLTPARCGPCAPVRTSSSPWREASQEKKNTQTRELALRSEAASHRGNVYIRQTDRGAPSQYPKL